MSWRGEAEPKVVAAPPSSTPSPRSPARTVTAPAAAPAPASIVPGKLRPPLVPDGVVARERILERLDATARVTTVVAPPGYGKTVAVRQWIDRVDGPVAWVSLDLLDDNPASLWRHLVVALRSAMPHIDEEPELLLAERGPDDPLFLTALLAQLQRTETPATVVIDGISHLTARSASDGLALLVERVGDAVRFVLAGRSEPAMPLARWRSLGWLSELRERDLRFTDAEAVEVVARSSQPALDPDVVRALNQRMDGWPIGLHLVLAALVDSTDADSAARAVVESERVLADYIAAEILDRLPTDLREAALSLSVLDWFDADLCCDLLGRDLLPAVSELRRRRMFLTVIDEQTGAMRFHALIRQLLEMELRWRDPERRIELHRRAAELWFGRGDPTTAYRHLRAIGASDDAHGLFVRPALELVDRGEVGQLRRMVRELPADLEVDDPSLALDLATLCFFAGFGDDAASWTQRAVHLADPSDPTLALRVASTNAILALMDGDLVAAEDHVARFRATAEAAPSVPPFETRFATVALRIALGDGRRDDARTWLAEARRITQPEIVVRVTVPALAAMVELLDGDADRAIVEAGRALDAVESMGLADSVPHQGVFEALVAGGRCHAAVGDLERATDLAEQAQSQTDLLATVWNHIRTGLLLAETARLGGDPDRALDVLEAVDPWLKRLTPGGLLDAVVSSRAAALVALDRLDEARTLARSINHDASRRRLAARLAALDGRAGEVRDLTADRSAWTTPERLDAEVSLALAEGGATGRHRLATALAEGARTRWVSPFLGHGPAVDELIAALPLEHVHPALARAMPRRRAAAGTTGGTASRRPGSLHEPFTARELTLLELLPTHLSYGQMGEQLYLSINTVKSNLKSIYRKLDATSRREAVEHARRDGLI